MQTKWLDELFKHVVVNPRVDYEYFDDHPEDFQEVVQFANQIVNGPRKTKNPLPGQGQA